MAITLAEGLKRLSKQYDVVQLEFVRVGGYFDDSWWCCRCKTKSDQRRWNISLGGWPTALSVVREALKGETKKPS